MHEVELHCFEGFSMYEYIPFQLFQQSPIGLIHHEDSSRTRLIFNLSYSNPLRLSINEFIIYGWCLSMDVHFMIYHLSPHPLAKHYYHKRRIMGRWLPFPSLCVKTSDWLMPFSKQSTHPIGSPETK